jgi:uncharacterized protein involved in response to NO
MAEAEKDRPSYHGPAFFSYGFRPFFLGAAIFSGVAVPVWILKFAGGGDAGFLYAPRDWHVHEMLFGFLPGVITGFLLTAIPNWTERSPVRGIPLMLLLTLWLAGRVVIAMPWSTPSFPPSLTEHFLLLWRRLSGERSQPVGAGVLGRWAG